MLGMDQGQRSNAVGFNTAYLPDGEGSRHGGGTYSGQATEPTIQDYENFFGPSARDIKTDLQRFKRHGRWHLPDILQGPNPWLTDRIDGLITDATNSPFTTKILPYRYKEEVDGKIKWNVWSFDEGMASRVPYESAARTLTQSKRSFAGYMVRQGMAIVLEHNFMMTPKGRENFKNQLNQLIGSIQYTNDLDVHMALILAPSYQKTMRERYYTSDKSPAQTCREFADLFGMMQKNVNALDILIEEGKAILRTWGGPMPDFLLCNSKLTFQMTMTPEKTNYITQGIDGVKRLRQGPDLGNYRGLSVIHSRAFSMETGQQPRDVLRRRVRTAEYYRILPSKKNVNREFEFYNEERDTWFTLTFHDLLKYARYLHEDGMKNDNASLVDGIFHRLSAGATEQPPSHHGKGVLGAAMTKRQFLDAVYRIRDVPDQGYVDEMLQNIGDALQANKPLGTKIQFFAMDIGLKPKTKWLTRGFTDNLGITVLPPKNNEVWTELQNLAKADYIPQNLCQTMLGFSPMTDRIRENLYMALKGQPLNDPLSLQRSTAAPGTGEWFAAFAFYMEIFERGGLPWQYVNLQKYDTSVATNNLGRLSDFKELPFADVRDSSKLDITLQYLSRANACGSVNHPMQMTPTRQINGAAVKDIIILQGVRAGHLFARGCLLTGDLLAGLLAKYERNGIIQTGLEILESYNMTGKDSREVQELVDKLAGEYNKDDFLSYSSFFNKHVLFWVQATLAEFHQVNPGLSTGELLSLKGIKTVPMGFTSQSHLFHPSVRMRNDSIDFKTLVESRTHSSGHLSIIMLDDFVLKRNEYLRVTDHPWFEIRNYTRRLPDIRINDRENSCNHCIRDIFSTIRQRIESDPAVEFAGQNITFNQIQTHFTGQPYDILMAYRGHDWLEYINDNPITRMTVSPCNPVVDWNEYFETSSPYPTESREPDASDLKHVENVELVIVRPNIEHNMLGVIMGLGGESLGNTLWGQTELSVYDDSMHGIWGMSYKYHERAIVFNEKNLIRMWDIAYDGYNGGKDDTYVNWLDVDDDSARYGPRAFKEATLDLTKNYRGPSMMVMAFVHNRSRLNDDGRNVYDQHFRRNWPSPIVFYDTYDRQAGQQQAEVLPIDYDNVQSVNVEEFRVFNNELYEDSYRAYRSMMPEFRTMHISRKTAGQSSADAETATDCLAFQGSMRIKEGGALIQEIQGSGHHGPDYVGIASVRAGKGQKVAGQAPAPYRLV